MLKEIIISRKFWKFRNYKDLCGKPCMPDWMAKVVFLIQMLPTFSGLCNRYFWDIQLKMLRLPNFNMLFQLVLRKLFKSELFSCLPKVDHVIKSYKEPIVTNINFLLTIPIHCQKKRLWELVKWSPKKNGPDLLSNSLKSFFKEIYIDQFGEFVCGY